MYICIESINLCFQHTKQLNMEQLERNFKIFVAKLEELGISTKTLVERYGEVIKNASFSHKADNGMAYQGALLWAVLYKVTPYALKLNEMFPEGMRVDRNKLIKVCLLHQLSKAVKLVKNTNEWQAKSGKQPYMYDPSQPSIRTGLHSMVMCQECGIPFTVEEADAMTANDRDLTDMQSKWHSSIFASIIRQASEMTYLEMMQATKEAASKEVLLE